MMSVNSSGSSKSAFISMNFNKNGCRIVENLHMKKAKMKIHEKKNCASKGRKETIERKNIKKHFSCHDQANSDEVFWGKLERHQVGRRENFEPYCDLYLHWRFLSDNIFEGTPLNDRVLTR